jgi:Carboxypeptidase regulatory-like domain/Peptidase family M1 domain
LGYYGGMRHTGSFGIAAALTALLCPAAVPASIHGLVKDQSGAAVTGAGVELREVPGPGAAKSTRTDGSGGYRFTNLAGSHYRVRVAQTGFKIYESDVTIDAGNDASLDIALSIAESRESINVSGGRRQTVDAVYHALREADIADVYGVENVMVRRDTGVLTLKKGSIGFTAPQMGRDTVMVFSGDGEFDFTPGLNIEKAHLKNLTGQEQVHENFDRAFFCFTDGTGKELRDQGTKQAADPKLTDLLHDYRKRLRGNTENIRSLTEALAMESAGNVEADLLADLYNAAARGSFTAFLHGRKHADLRFAVRPRGVFPALAPEEVAVVNVDPGAEQEGIWYLSHMASEFQNHTASSDEDNRVVEGASYRIETVIGKNDHLAATAVVAIRGLTDGDRVIDFDLLPTLRVTRVSMGGQDIPFIQEDRKHDGSFYVVLPQPLQKGGEREILIEYQGDKVVHNAGGGNFSVGARTSWYPSLNAFRDHTRFHLVFKVPRQYTLVSVGKMVKQWTERDFGCTEWDSEVRVPVAGFNYGEFKKRAVTDSTLKNLGVEFGIEGYAVAALPDSLKGAESIGGMSPARMNENVMVEAQNAMRVFDQWFGKSEFNRIAITQQPEMNFGQSWPTLVYLPIIAYFDSTQRWEMGASSTGATEFVDEVTAHEVSHQWWGHMVGWSSYHDQWLSEGFAFFSAGLYLQFIEKKDPEKYLAYWSHAHKLLTEKNGFGKRPNDAGPVWMGLRLDNFKNPGGYSSVVYRKGGYVLHMLRSMMWNSKDGDQTFQAMMQEFVKTYTNRNASTEAFQELTAKYMTPAMDVEGNHRLDWFFRQWVYGTTIPRYKFEPGLTSAPDGKWLLKATLTQSEVTPNFTVLVPVYADFDGQIARLGSVRMTGNSANDKIQVLLPKKPRKVMINAFHDVLEM